MVVTTNRIVKRYIMKEFEREHQNESLEMKNSIIEV
jgi:hypothetical protein